LRFLRRPHRAVARHFAHRRFPSSTSAPHPQRRPPGGIGRFLSATLTSPKVQRSTLPD